MKKIISLTIVIGFSALVSAGIHKSAPAQVELVDLGLSVNWASFNIGATSPEQAGTFFAWGETESKQTYDWPTYKYGKQADQMTKYCTNPNWGLDKYSDTLSVLLPEDDAATANWGEDWRMPTMYEWLELLHHCTWTWVDDYNGTQIAGYQVTSPVNGNSIFLPTSGYKYQSYKDCITDGYYWSSSLDDNEPSNAWLAYFYIDDKKHPNYKRESLYRDCGRPVRPVSVAKNPVREDGLELQQLIDNTPAGGTLTLDKDYILGAQTPDGVFITKSVTLDLNGHVIDGNQLVRCLYIMPENKSDKIVIEDNSTEGTGSITKGFSQFGGAIYAATGDIVLNSGHITNSATDHLRWGGGGIYLDTDATLTMNGGDISYNHTDFSGAGGIYSAGQFNMYGGSISNNYTLSWGGGLRINGKTNIYGGHITNNTAQFGGGIFVNNEEEGMPVVLNLTSQVGDSIVITGNTATGAQGGVTGNGRINLSGKIICKDNICNTKGYTDLKNFWAYTPVHIVGDMTDANIFFGAADGNTDKPVCRIFAYDYSKYNTVDFTNYFTFEGTGSMSAVLNAKGHIEIVTGTGLENPSTSATINKLLHNGHVIVNKNGKHYNMLGQEVNW